MYEKLHSPGFAAMAFVFAGRVFTSRYLRLNKGTCGPSHLLCPLFKPVPHEPLKSVPKTSRKNFPLYKEKETNISWETCVAIVFEMVEALTYQQ